MNLVIVFAVSFAAFLGVIALMAVGVLLGRREISGSCGGLGQGGDGDREGGSCSLCSNPDAACRELAKRQRAGGQPEGVNSSTATMDADVACAVSAADGTCRNEAMNAEDGR